MKVGELIDVLQELDPERVVVVSGFHSRKAPIGTMDLGMYQKSSESFESSAEAKGQPAVYLEAKGSWQK